MKAQLVLLGGRSSVPNLLTILYQQPDEVFVLTSNESTQDFGKFKNLIKKYHPSCSIEEIGPVDAFNYEAISELCRTVFQDNLDAEWICNITAATTIMSIGVYEQAKLCKLPCWYLNTANSRVICLVGPKIGEEEEKKLFHLTVEQYVNAYYHELKNGDMEDRRNLAEQNWLPFAQMLAKDPSVVACLKGIFDKARSKNNPNSSLVGDTPGKPDRVDKHGKVGGPKHYILRHPTKEEVALLTEAKKVVLIDDCNNPNDSFEFRLNYIQYSFLSGAWLEVYIWNEAKQANLFDDCQWNRKIEEGATREFDVAITYKAQLIIVECKTGKDKKSDIMRDLVSAASLVGHKFVGKIVASSFLTLSTIDDDSKAKAHQDSIVLVLADEILNIRQRLIDEAKTPTYSRI